MAHLKLTRPPGADAPTFTTLLVAGRALHAALSDDALAARWGALVLADAPDELRIGDGACQLGREGLAMILRQLHGFAAESRLPRVALGDWLDATSRQRGVRPHLRAFAGETAAWAPTLLALWPDTEPDIGPAAAYLRQRGGIVLAALAFFPSQGVTWASENAPFMLTSMEDAEEG